MSGLPSGWAMGSLNELVATGGLFSDGDWIESKDQDPEGENRLLQLADIGDGIFVDKSSRFVNNEKFQLLNCTELHEGDVLIARMPDPLGRACLMPRIDQRCLTVVDVAVFRSGSCDVSHKLLMHFLNSPQVRKTIEIESSGTTRKRIARGKLAALELPIPPAAEQTRIAQKLDELLAQVDTLKTRIDAIPALLKRFRQSVLAAAVSGRLTEEWRAQHVGWVDEGSPTTEPNRNTESWASQAQPNLRAISQASKAPLGELITEMRNGLSAKPNEDGKGLPILRISSVRAGSVDQTDIRFLECGEAEKERYSLKDGDLLFTRYNGSLELVGVCGLLRQSSHTTLVYPDKLIRVRCNTEIVLPDYIEIFFSELSTRQRVMDLVKSTSGQKGISGQDLKEIVVTYPDITEQTEIVRRVEQLFAFADQLEARVVAAKSRIDHLTQSILAKAFRGELVPQDPNDEPASVLLERIKAQHAAAPKAKRGRKSA